MNNRINPESLVAQITDLIKEHLPQGLEEAGTDLRKNMTSLIKESLTKMDLVTREEFEIQQKVLSRTRTRLEQLERQLSELEARLTAHPSAENAPQENQPG